MTSRMCNCCCRSTSPDFANFNLSLYQVGTIAYTSVVLSCTPISLVLLNATLTGYSCEHHGTPSMGCSHHARLTSIPKGRSVRILTPETPPYCTSIQKLIVVMDLLYGPVAFCAKLSLFLLYYRLFSRRKWVRYLVYLGIGATVATYTATTIVYGYLCLPRHGQGWIEAGLSSRCHKQFIMIVFVLSPFNLLSDLYLLLVPLPAIWHLHLPLRKRLGIAGIFLTGSL